MDDAIDYVALAIDAKELIEANGRECSFKRAGRAPANSNKPWRGPAAAGMSPESTDPISINGVIAVIVPQTWDENLKEIVRRPTAQLLVAHDSFVTVLGAGLVPDISTFDTVEDGVQTWRICAVSPLMPGVTPLIYQMKLEG
jgi:hypothetical protein